jgi:hypothetical protein
VHTSTSVYSFDCYSSYDPWWLSKAHLSIHYYILYSFNLNTHNMPTSAELRKQLANMALALAEMEKVEKEEARKAAEAEEARKAAEAEEVRKTAEVEAKKQADAAEVEKEKKVAQKEVDQARKATVRALAESKKGKEKSTEVESGSASCKDCNSCKRKGWKCEWRLVSPVNHRSSRADHTAGGPIEGLLGLPSRSQQMHRER